MVLVLELFCCHCCSVTKLCPTFCDPVNCMQHGRHPCPSPSPGGFKFMSIELVMLSNQHILCHPLLLLPSIFPNIRIFSSELTVYIRWPKCWRFSFSINPSNEYSGLISLRIDWFDLLAVQGTLKGPLQHHNSKASILQCLAFFMVQLLYPYMTTGETIALTGAFFKVSVMALVFAAWDDEFLKYRRWWWMHKIVKVLMPWT